MGDQTGSLSTSDMMKAARGLGYNFANSDMQKILADFGGLDYVRFDDFNAILSNIKTDYTKGGLIEAFKMFDKDERGAITGNDLKGVLGAWSNKLTGDEIDRLFKTAGFSDSTQINYAEFADKLVADTQGELC